MGNLTLRIEDKYQSDRRLGGGSFGEVYQGHDLKTGQEVALKLEYVQIDPSLLENEIEIYEELSGGPGIPRVYWHGEECEFRVMVFELLGPNLENLFNYCGWKFSLKTRRQAGQLTNGRRKIRKQGVYHRRRSTRTVFTALKMKDWLSQSTYSHAGNGPNGSTCD